MKRSLLISVLSFVVGCGASALLVHHAKDQVEKRAEPVARDWLKDAEGISEITLEREMCNLSCPVYKVVLRRDGMATYTGKQNVPLIGKYKSKTPYPPGFQFVSLAKLIAAQRYLEMNDLYATPGAIDTTSVITNVIHNGKRKTIVNRDNLGPIELYGIEMAIDAVAAQTKWEEDKE